jgi:hypothetical protein
MRLYFLRNVRAEYAPGKEFKEGCVYDIPLNNIATMLDNKFAVPESEKPEKTIVIKTPRKRGAKKKK